MVPSLPLCGVRRLIFASLFLALPLCAGLSDARAQDAGNSPGNGDVFTVEDVPVDATAQSAAQARETALARGQAEAFNRLLSRLTLSGDAQRLPRPSAAQISDLVRGFEVEGERASSVRYIANLRVRFRDDAVRNLLRQNGMPFAETRSKPMLILPVLDGESGAILWEQDTYWRAAWAVAPRSEGLVPLIVPVGDLDDLRAITAELALAGDAPGLAAIAQRYGAGDVIVAVATPQYAGESVASVQVTINRFSALGQDETVIENYDAPSGAAPNQDVWVKAAAGVAANIEDAWKRSALIRYDSQRSLTATLALAGIDELVEMRRRFGRVAILRNAELVYLARDEAQFRFDYFGDERQLATAFAQSDLLLEQGETGWRLRPRVAAGAATGRLGTLPGASAPGAAISIPAAATPDGAAKPDEMGTDAPLEYAPAPSLLGEPIIIQ
ncbi:MAG: DUF2066 domain-containing protein [Alphaproteobacteria bacterium]